ncbi:UNVERIFIED_ORG: hypothetical protein ABIC54_001616 [Burkholderia sp. 1263]|jgi:hypothetical protein
MTAPIANPSWPLKIERVKRKIRAITPKQKCLITPDIAAAIVVLTAEMDELRMAYARELMGDRDARTLSAGSIYERHVRSVK